MKDGRRIWQTYDDLDLKCDLFPEIGAAFEERARINKGFVGSAESRLFRQREAVDFAVEWLLAREKGRETV
jgi:aminoglycoside 3-N-acetyltransferase